MSTKSERIEWSELPRRVRDRELLVALSPGGARERPIEVRSAAVIEPRVGSMNCPHCGGTYRIHEHELAAPRVRRIEAGCRNCSAPRTIWFLLVIDEPN